MSHVSSQLEICERFGSLFSPTGENEKVGIALATLSQVPLNALRHPVEAGTSGWYIWGGEFSDNPEFFQPLHAYHLVAHAPALIPYLALAPGWRVLLAPGYEDVWYDPTLLAG
jgi:hypothetical protein